MAEQPSARVERRLQWWKQNKKKVERSGSEPVDQDSDKRSSKVTAKGAKKRADKQVLKDSETHTNINKGFTSQFLEQEAKSPADNVEKSPKKPSKKKRKSIDIDVNPDEVEDNSAVMPSASEEDEDDQKLNKRTKLATEKDKNTSEEGKETEKKGKKYVLFIGNLPYRAQIHHVEKHFSKCSLESVRLMTDKKTRRSRGFAYIELKNGKGFKQALLLHQSELLGRQINVEFTTIGGGKSKLRAQRLKMKNARCERFKVLRPESERYWSSISKKIRKMTRTDD